MTETPPTAPTPLVSLAPVGPGLFGKLEYVHPTRSAKFRALVPYLRQAARAGDLVGVERVAIRSAGSAAVTVAWACRELGLTAEAVIPEQVDDPQLMGALGALGVVVHRLAADAAASLMQQPTADPSVHVLDQFHDPRVVGYYRPLAAEILDQRPDVVAIVAGIGTGATIMGLADELRARNSNCRVIGVWPAEFDPTWRRPYRAHGISGLAPPVRETHLRPESIDSIVQVPSAAAARRARQVFRELGLPGGTSSGATVEAALELRRSGLEGTLVCLFASACNSASPDQPGTHAR